MKRTCGDCKACCYGPEVKTGVRTQSEHLVWLKPRRQVCGYVCERGCAIQAKKPVACQDFECEWLKGNIEAEDMRPDRSGIIFWRESGDMLRDTLVAEEAYAGAENEPRFREHCLAASQHETLLVYRRGPSRTIMIGDQSKTVADLMRDPRMIGAKLVPYEHILDEIEDLNTDTSTWIKR